MFRRQNRRRRRVRAALRGTVSESCGGGFIHESRDFETRDAACVFCGLALRVIEIRGHGDYRALDGLAEKLFGPVFQFAQNKRGNFGGSKNAIAETNANYALAFGVDAKRKNLQFIGDVGGAAAHEAFHAVNRAIGLRE